MIKPGRKADSRLIFFATLAVLAAVLLFLAPRAAVNVDEQLHYPHAKKVVNWYFTLGQDQGCLDTPVTNLKYYGQSVDNFTALVNRIFGFSNEFLVRHTTGAFFFWLLLLFTGLLARRLTGSWALAAVTVMALVFMPRLAGHAFGNLKDIPFATGYMAGLLMIIRLLDEMPRPRWRTALLLGLAIAFTVSVRAGGFILFAYLGMGLLLFFALKPDLLRQILSTKALSTRLIAQGVAILIVGYFVGLLFWPYALQNVFTNPLESLRVMEYYKVSIRQVFEGELLWSTQLPRYYLPKWLLISTPLFVLTGFALFLLWFLRGLFSKGPVHERSFLEFFILFSAAFPFFYVIAIDANLYSGIRQMLFILPPLALLAVWGVYRSIECVKHYNKKAAHLLIILFSGLLACPFVHQATTFPVDYVYFNIFAGGNKKAWGHFEYDYYFHALKKPAHDLIDLLQDEEATVAMNTNLHNYFQNHPNISHQYTRYLERSSFDWDYGVFGLNYIHPYLLKNGLWQPHGLLKTWYHKGNPVAILVKRTDNSDFLGISAIKSGNLQEGIEWLEKAIEKDPNNVWLHAQLAQAKLKTGDMDGFHNHISMGREIYPAYEPFFLLEAVRLFETGNLAASREKLNELFEVNPRYLPAGQLRDELYKKGY